MKTKLTTLFAAIVLMMTGTANLNAQISEECITTGSIFVEAAKVKNYEAARPSFEKLRKDCPNWSLALYQYGERLLKADLKKATGDAKTAVAQDLISFLKQREQYFPAKTPAGKNASNQAQILFDNKIGTKKSQYDAFNAAFAKDAASISSSKSIYTRFKLAVDLFKANELPLQNVFDLYDETQEKLNKEATKLDGKLQKLLDKEESGTALTAKEARRKKGYITNLKAFATFGSSTDGAMGELGNCENLIPLYTKDFEANKNDVAWLKKSAGRLAGKDCTDSDLFVSMVEELHRLEPSARSAQYLGILALKRGDEAEAEKYFLQAVELETDPKEKAKSLFRLAETARKKGSYGKARGLYNRTLQEDPTMGRCYLRIAAMYASSANNCGDSVFNKRAVYWLAANTAERAGRVSPSLAKTANATAVSYRAKAPDKSMIFNQNMGGKTISIGCWIRSSVRVPNL
ncbi:tetratricopeptide repeat protein [uncultured Dokdonia sp.]|uniref:tetratricopeptide repeat protein n=1 Tax=uncultured Dokdonia sp. TaxID=575653 RepID=UPI0026388273|nr:tetratricopeptide repeat protein [uncultured Dokdonia sp.]